MDEDAAAVKTRTLKSTSATSTKGSITRMASRRKRPVSATELLADAGIDLAQVMGDLDQQSAVNASRVVKLHDRIAAGEYAIDTVRVAGKLLRFEKSLDE